jgi:serine/threonine-protein kinase
VALAGQGAFANIYRARPAGSFSSASYAIKRLKPECENDPRAIGMLRREARVGRAVTSPHLLAVLDARIDAPPFYLVMPWLRGRTLAACLRSRQSCAGDAILSPRQVRSESSARAASERDSVPLVVALWIARQVACALDALARAGWTHGDVKPANVMISPEGHVTLLDLGLARRPADEDRTFHRAIAGTPWYLAPEALLSTLRPDMRSDIFSLGAVLYEMLAGRVPFAATSAEELIALHRQAEPAELRALRPHVPATVSQLVHGMLAKEPLRRPQTPQEIIARLASAEIAHFSDGCG